MVIVEENRNESDVIGSRDAPYVNSLAQRYGQATMAFGQSHPSLPNYLELLSGSTQGVTDDGTGYAFAAPTLVGQLQSRGIGWRAYMEGMPSPCYSGAGSNGYAKKHDPFMYFTAIMQNARACSNVVPFSQLRTDLDTNAAPPFLWVTPNLCNDGHDCSTAVADRWLSHVVPEIQATAAWKQDGILVITWDEGEDAANHILTLVIRPGAPHATSNRYYDHYSLLATIENRFGVARLGAAGQAAPLTDLMISGAVTQP